MKKLIAILLSLLMLMSVLALGVSAVEDPDEPDVSIEEPVIEEENILLGFVLRLLYFLRDIFIVIFDFFIGEAEVVLPALM